MDFYIESCKKNHGRIYNFIVENGYGKQYKPTNKTQF